MKNELKAFIVRRILTKLISKRVEGENSFFRSVTKVPESPDIRVIVNDHPWRLPKHDMEFTIKVVQ